MDNSKVVTVTVGKIDMRLLKTQSTQLGHVMDRAYNACPTRSEPASIDVTQAETRALEGIWNLLETIIEENEPRK